MAQPPPRPVILIEVTRFACALAVMACHYGVGFWRAPGVHPARLLAGIGYTSPAERWVQFGWLGVEIFFVISGLVITRSIANVTAAGFVRQRVLRLAPAAWVCATATLVVLGLANGFDGGLGASWVRAVTFWPAGLLVDGSYWTLGIELAFYIVVALCLASGGGVRRIEALAVAIGVASLAFWIACALAGERGAALVTGRAVELTLLKHGCFFALGVTIARCQADGATPIRLAAIAATLGAGSLEVAVHAIESANDTGLPRAIAPALLLFLMAVALLAASDRAQPWLERRVRPATARAIGMATYPLYLLHQDAGAALVALAVRRGASPGAALIATAAIMLAAAAAVARVGEPAVRARLAAALSISRRHDPGPDSHRSASPRAG